MEKEYLKIINHIDKLKKKIWKNKDWLGYPINAYHICGREDPPIFITGGAYGMTRAPLYAIFELALSLNYERKIIALPSRNPTSFLTIIDIIDKMFNVRINTIEEINKTVIEYGGENIIKENKYRIDTIKNIGFFYHKDVKDPTMCRNILTNILEQYNLWDQLDSIRMLCPILYTNDPNIDSFHTLFIYNRDVLDHDTIITKNIYIPEIQSFKELLNEISPIIVIDLEEEKRLLVKVNSDDEKINASIKLSLSQIHLEDRKILKEYEKGLLKYLSDHNIYGIQIFTSFSDPLEKRVDIHTTLVKSLINIFGLTYIL